MTQVVLPGDVVPVVQATNVQLGPGLVATGSGAIESLRAGLVGTASSSSSSSSKKQEQQVWIESRGQKRYTASAHEPVIGIVQVRHAEGYRVDIGTSSFANVDALSFEGATKRSKPNLKVGSVLYGHLLPTPAFSEPEMACVDLATQKSAGYGPLDGGFLVRDVELARCRELLVRGNSVLESIAKQGGPFEVAVGMNGRVWVKVPEGDEERMPSIVSIIKGH